MTRPKIRSFFLLFARFSCNNGFSWDQTQIYDQTKIHVNNKDSLQNEETISTGFENNPCRKIFAFSVSKSKEVYF